MEFVAEVSLLEELGETVSRLTTSGNPSLDNVLLKKLKTICKKSELYVKHAYHLVLTQLKKNHAEIRQSSFQIINELFLRSHAFRELLLVDFQIFLELTVETDPKQPLPPPKSAAKNLKEKTLQAIESWYQKYGPHYKKLDLGYSYLKRVKNVEFNAVSARTQAERYQSEERARRKRNFINGQIIRVENEMSEMVSQMELCVTEIENCFKLLLPHPDEYDVYCGGDTPCGPSELKTVILKDVTRIQDTKEDGGISSSQVDQVENEASTCKDDNNEELLTDHGYGTRSYQLSIKVDRSGPEIKETVDNTIVLKTVREMFKEMTHRHLPMINKWLSVLTKGEGMQQKIQQLIDLKRSLEAAKDKFSELKITPMTDAESNASSIQGAGTIDDDDDDDDADDFEDVPEKEGLELVIPPGERAEYGLEPLPTTHQSWKESEAKMTDKEAGFLKHFGADPRDLGDPTSRATALFQVRNQLANSSSTAVSKDTTETVADERKKRLLERAPVVPFDMDLYFWGDPTANVHKMVKTYLDNNWASKEHEGEYVIGDGKEARPTRMVTFAGNFEPVKWSCRAPLPSGKLCPRRDRVKCPFHGKIIPRDETGTPVNTTGAESDTPGTSEGSTPTTSQEQTRDSYETEWKEVGLEIEAATGLDLGGKSKRKRKSNSKASDKKALKGSGLTDLKKHKNTAKTRLEKIVLNKKAIQRVAHEMDAIATKRCSEKFGNQFNYSLQK